MANRRCDWAVDQYAYEETGYVLTALCKGCVGGDLLMVRAIKTYQGPGRSLSSQQGETSQKSGLIRTLI